MPEKSWGSHAHPGTLPWVPAQIPAPYPIGAVAAPKTRRATPMDGPVSRAGPTALKNEASGSTIRNVQAEITIFKPRLV